MVEEVKNTPEENLLEEVKSKVAEGVADKADISALDAVKASIPSVEGYAKSEELEGFAKSADVDALSAKLEETLAAVKAAPSLNKGVSAMEHKGFTWDNSESFNAKTSINLGNEITKAYNTTTQVDGEPTSTARLYYALQQYNPFRSVSTTMPMNSSTMELPVVTGITAQAEANIPSAISTASGHGGDIGSVQLITQNWTSRTLFSDQSVEDLPGLDGMVAGFMGQQIAVREATDMVAQLKLAANASSGAFGRITTATAAGANGNARLGTIANFSDMMASLSSAYLPNAKFMVSRPVWANLRSQAQAGVGSDLVYDPSMSAMTLFGFPIMVNDHLETFGAANNLIGLFGDFSAGTIIGSRKEMQMSRHEDTIPGGVYYYGNMRSRGQDWDRAALIALRAGA